MESISSFILKCIKSQSVVGLDGIGGLFQPWRFYGFKSPQIVRYTLSSSTHQKNAHGKIIILYDDDERLASQAATTMCERGFENLFMLSGGQWGWTGQRGGVSSVGPK